jgi:RNA polymerase sigma factor (TIGR02999 family)
MTAPLHCVNLSVAGRSVIEYALSSEWTMHPPAGEVTRLLHAWSAGDRTVEDRLFSLVLPDLRNLAQCLVRQERRDATLQPSALLNEAYMRLLAARERDWENRRHFFAVAARVMRRLLIDHARARKQSLVVPIDGAREPRKSDPQVELSLAVDRLLDELQLSHPDWCSIVELKYFMGFTDPETADALGLPVRTVQRRFGDARRWLYERLNPAPCKMNANAMTS